MLKNLQALAYKNAPDDDPVEFHRATLFKHVRMCFSSRCFLYGKAPWDGWVVTVERSGHSTLGEREAFWAPDKAAIAHGVAGRTWAIKGILTIVDLPDPADDTKVEEYALNSFVSAKWVRKTKVRARSFIGIPIDVKGKRWGAVVLDSQDPHPPDLVETTDGKIQLTKPLAVGCSLAAEALGTILEGH